MLDRLLTRDEVAETLRVTTNTLWRWRQSGTGPAFIKFGNNIRYRREVLNAWINAHTYTSDEHHDFEHEGPTDA